MSVPHLPLNSARVLRNGQETNRERLANTSRPYRSSSTGRERSSLQNSSCYGHTSRIRSRQGSQQVGPSALTQEMLDLIKKRESSRHEDSTEEEQQKRPHQIFIMPHEILDDHKLPSPFVSFNSLVNTYRQCDEAFDPDLCAEKPSQARIRKQLRFNQQQQEIYNQTIEKVRDNTFETLKSKVVARVRLENTMPKVKMYMSKHAKVQKSFFEEALESTPAEENLKKSLQPRQPAIMGIFSQSCKAYVTKAVEHLNYKALGREGATLTVVGRYAFLYGGLSKDALSTMEVLDLSSSCISFALTYLRRQLAM